jgi:Arc/MetJ-type ribon-helix-helix transcriptional regulator
MQIEISPEIEQIARNAVATGRYESVEAFIAAAVQEGVQIVQTAGTEQMGSVSVTPNELPDAEWDQRFEEFLSSRRPTNPDFDGCRDSIYPVR